MKTIKISDKSYKVLEGARLYAQVDRKKSITKSQMIESLAYKYLWS